MRILSLFRRACCGLVLGMALAIPAGAQVVPAPVLPGAVQPGRDRTGPIVPTQPDFDFSIVSPHRSAVPRAVDEVHFKLTDIKITGTTTIVNETFRPLYQGLIGKDITLADILDIADRIEAEYRARGYLLVRAYVPPQRVRDGIFTINVVEGYLATITVQGGDPSARARIRRYLAPATASRPLTLVSMERGLLLVNDLPGVTATGVLRPSPDTPGASDLVVDVAQPWISGGVAVDNRGSRFSGIWTVTGDVEITPAFGDDQVMLTATISPNALEQAAGSVRYRRAIGDDGLLASLIGSVSHGEPGSTLAIAGVLTDSYAVGPRLSYPLIRTRDETLLLDGGFTVQDARIDVAGAGISHDQWRVIDIGGSYQRGGILGGNWVSTFDVAQGLPILGASPNGTATTIGGILPRSRYLGQTDFTKFTAFSRLAVPFADAFSAVFALQGQYSLSRLITGEQIAFGGVQIGRGYDPGAITGDHGIGGSLELRYDYRVADTYLKVLEPYLYVDAAQAWYKNDPTGPSPTLLNQNILSVGGGVRFWLAYDVTASIEGAHTFRHVPGSDNDQVATKLLVDLAVRF
ncbi:MAG TPA: POTRA domain-containing protein [Rhizomicrobium sp.]